jgi:ketosteroid isomerase-like protein
VATRSRTQGRSKEHHVAVGLGFLSAFQNGDIDACMELLHPQVEWYPTPKLLETEVMRGRDRVRHYVEALYERFGAGLEVTPEEGRQVGDHLLMCTLFQGNNTFTQQPIQERGCWVVSVRDDRWGRIVSYPNAPVARLGFEDLLKTAPAAEPQSEATPGVRVAPAMENAAPTPAELAQVDAPPVAAPTPSAAGDPITLTFTLEEAEALNRWLLESSHNGGLAADDPGMRPVLVKVRSAVEHAQAIAAVRKELEQASIATQHLSDQQVAELGRRISQAAPRLGAAAH